MYNKLCYSHILNNAENSKITNHTAENMSFLRLNSHLVEDAMDQVGAFQENASFLVDETSTNDDELLAIPANSQSNEISSHPMPIITTCISTLPTATAIVTPAGTAFLPPNITIKPLASSK